MRRSRVQAAAVLLLTFLAGGAAGMAADRLLWQDDQGDRAAREEGAREEQDHDRRDDERRRKTTIERFADELGLTPEQRSRIETILEEHRESMKEMWGEVRPRYDSLRDSAREEIEAVLTPSQVDQYRNLLERRYDADFDDEADEEADEPARDTAASSGARP